MVALISMYDVYLALGIVAPRIARTGGQSDPHPAGFLLLAAQPTRLAQPQFDVSRRDTPDRAAAVQTAPRSGVCAAWVEISRSKPCPYHVPS